MSNVLVGTGFITVISGYRYVPIFGLVKNVDTSYYDVEVPFAVAGTLARLYVKISGTPGEGNGYIIKVLKNGEATDLAVTIANSETDGYNEVNSVGVASGDRFCIRIRGYSYPTQRTMHISVVFYPDLDSESILLGVGDLDTNIFYCPLVGFGSITAEGGSQMIVAQGATISDLYVQLETAPGSGKLRTFTLRKNGADTELTLTISDSSTSGNDTVHSVNVAEGDLICLKATQSGSPPDTGRGASVKLTGIAGDYLIGGCQCTALGDTYTTVIGCLFGSEPDYIKNAVADDMVLKNLYVKLAVAPGAGKSYTITLVKDSGGGEVETDLAVTISNTDTTGSDDTVVALAKGDLFRLKWAKSGGPVVASAWYGLTAESIIGVVVVTVETHPVTDRTKTTCTGNGYITSTGGDNAHRRGFCYLQGTSGDPDVEDSVEYEDGDFGVGAYSLAVTELDSGLPYRVRAYAINSAGIAYGETVDSTVLIYPTIDIRVSSIRRIYKPGLLRMEVALGDLGFDIDVSEAAIRRVSDEVKEPEEPKEEVPEEKAKDLIDKIIKEQKETKLLETMFPEPSDVSGKYTAPSPMPTLKPSVMDKPIVELIGLDKIYGAMSVAFRWLFRI